MTKRIISFICVVAMLASMCVVSASALTIDSALSANWNAMGVKYSTRTKTPIIDSDTNAVKTQNFKFNATADGGIDMGIPTYNDFPGAYGASVITSKNKTDLADLSIEIDPDNFDFQQDSLTIANTVGIIWSEDPIENIDGLATADATAFNGLRHLIPSKKDSDAFELGVPVAKAKAEEISGKALYVGITNANPANAGTKVASNVNIVYFDGHYINKNDGHPGYRWTFTARNGNGPLGDHTPIATNYEELDLSEGLKITIKEDVELGYIVNINGKDYYEGKSIAYFPDADVNGKSHTAITDDDVDNKTDVYTTSMTYARESIDLTGLKEAGQGYLTVGVTGINDSGMTHGTDIVIKKINTKTPSTWKGEPACYHTEKEWVVTKEPNCGYEGVDSYTCKACGKVFETKAIPTVGEHNPVGEWTVAVEPDCTNEGKEVNLCTKCGLPAEEKVIPADPEKHNKGWKTTPATCEAEGLRERYCKICEMMFPEENMVLDPTGHTFGTYVADEDYNCETGGTETAKCANCDATDTREKATGEHVAGEWEETKAPTTEAEGERVKKCTVCGTVLETEVIDKLPTIVFPDVPQEGQWYSEGVYYCATKGYITGNDKGEFVPNGNLTREQFVVILARVAGADLSKYTTTKFADVDAKGWYGPSVIWANEEGYVNGIGDGSKFGVGQNMTREQLATMFFRYAGKNGVKVDGKANLAEFTDAASIGDWAKEACEWAIDAALLGSTKTDAKVLAPQMAVTRAQAAKIFMSYDIFAAK